MPLDIYTDHRFVEASDVSRFATLLSLENAAELSDISMARMISDGLPPQVYQAFSDRVHDIFSIRDVVPESTLRRVIKSKSRLSPDHSERLYDLSRVLDAAALAYDGDNDKMRHFLTMPHPLLEGEMPLTLAKLNSAGADIVIDLLRQADAGVAL